jgi:formiminotetrahydrofolate cyclodeaminase
MMMGGIGLNTFDAWLDDLANRGLPGGVAAAAVAAAMGAALVEKVAAVTLRHQPLSKPEQRRLVALIDLAGKSRDELQRLAGEDARAYRQVLQTGTLPKENAERRLAWHRATDIPLCVAEVCQELLLQLDLLTEACWSAVSADLRIGRRFLVAGRESGLEVVEENLRAWAEGAEAQGFRSRIGVVRGEES